MPWESSVEAQSGNLDDSSSGKQEQQSSILDLYISFRDISSNVDWGPFEVDNPLVPVDEFSKANRGLPNY